MKNSKINSMNKEEMIRRYMNSRTSDFDWSMPSSIATARSNVKLGNVQKAVLNESGVLH